ncbi:MAG: UTP--glucose-1-phosphate uridylyltransferase GalU [Acidobacteriota bacterium]
MKVKKAVIPVAGLGTRLLPATKAIPKELVPVVSKPAVQWVVESAVESGIEEIIFVNSAGKQAIEDHFDGNAELERTLESKGKTALHEAVVKTRNLAKVASVRQHAPLGLGHAVLQARQVVGDAPFAVILPDELVCGEKPALAQCLEAAEATDGPVIGIVEVPKEDVFRYGIVAAEEHGETTRRITDMVEKPPVEEAPSNLAITGPYVLSPEVFDLIAATEPGSGGEIQITDALRQLAQQRPVHGRFIEGARLDVGQPMGFVQANVTMGLQDPELGESLRAWLKEMVAD